MKNKYAVNKYRFVKLIKFASEGDLYIKYFAGSQIYK